MQTTGNVTSYGKATSNDLPMLLGRETCFEPNLVIINDARSDRNYVVYQLSDGSILRVDGFGYAWELDDILTNELNSDWINLSKA